jgi:hypothetical protein
MRLLLDIEEDKASFILELLKNFTFVKTEKLSPQNIDFINDLKEAVEEVKSIKKGKSTGRPVADLIHEL